MVDADSTFSVLLPWDGATWEHWSNPAYLLLPPLSTFLLHGLKTSLSSTKSWYLKMYYLLYVLIKIHVSFTITDLLFT